MCCYSVDINLIVNAVEAIGVLGTFIVGIVQLKKHSVQIVSLEEKVLSAEYKPDLRVESYSGRSVISNLEICLRNYSLHSVKLLEVTDNMNYLQNMRDLPYTINSSEFLYLYFRESIVEMPKDFSVELLLEDALQKRFLLSIVSENGKILTKQLTEKKYENVGSKTIRL